MYRVFTNIMQEETNRLGLTERRESVTLDGRPGVGRVLEGVESVGGGLLSDRNGA
jgi:hypothetical protein